MGGSCSSDDITYPISYPITPSVSTTDELLISAQKYKESFNKGHLPLHPAKKVTIVTCMDARLNLYGLFNLQEGDAHVIRNPGGVVTLSVLRSLAISQRLLGTNEIILIRHTNCAMSIFTDEAFKNQICQEVGQKPNWGNEMFTGIHECIERIKSDPFIPNKNIRGFMYDVETGGLEEVV